MRPAGWLPNGVCRKAQASSNTNVTSGMKTPLRPIAGASGRGFLSCPASNRKRPRDCKALFQEDQADPISVRAGDDIDCTVAFKRWLCWGAGGGEQVGYPQSQSLPAGLRALGTAIVSSCGSIASPSPPATQVSRGCRCGRT